ncbi:MAG: efflux RND transporter permease subunit [Thauera sp.]|nr:efflux RND transporter permease subunit [Thauera sp.]
MNFTDFFIRRPVLATALSLAILLLGARAWMEMSVRQFPRITSTVVTVTTVYPGASPETVQAFITTPLQQAIATAPGIDYITANSETGMSAITVNMRLNYDPDAAMAQTLAKVNQARNQLPPGSFDPVINATVGGATALMWVSFRDEGMNPQQLNDYVLRIAKPRIESVDGVGEARISPGGNDSSGNAYALRVWLDPVRMAARGLTAAEVSAALAANNFVSAVGSTRNEEAQVSITADTSLQDVDAFKRLIVRSSGTRQVRLQDVAEISLGTQNYNQMSFFNGHQAVFLGVEATPEANELELTDGVHAVLAELRTAAPPGLHIDLAYDSSKFIKASLEEVLLTIGVTMLVVVCVIFLFLGSLRSLLLPALAIPLSVVGAGLLMLMLGFTVNLLTLLAMVLAIGLVVDDAIIVLENVQRLIDDGRSPLQAALEGTRELATPILIMTSTLVAVYVPIAFMGGLTGSLFTEFAFTLVAAVTVSMVVALTFTPMLCARLLRPTPDHGLTHLLERLFAALQRAYGHSLAALLDMRAFVIFATVCVLASLPLLFAGSQHELAPTEDQGTIMYAGTGPATATRQYLDTYNGHIQKLLSSHAETEIVWQISGVPASGGAGANAVFGGANLRHWDERERSLMALMPQVQGQLASITGLETVAFSEPALPGSSGGLPIQFVLSSAGDYASLDEAAGTVIGAAMASGQFAFLTKNLRIDAPALALHIRRELAASLGLDMRTIGDNLSALFSEGLVGRFDLSGRGYQVIPLLADARRADVNALDDQYLRSASGKLLPLRSVVEVKPVVQPQFLPEFQQLNAVTIQGVAAPGVTLGQALDHLRELAENTLGPGFGIDHSGESRQLVQQGSSIMLAFVLAVVLVFLLLAAQFESFRDPFIVMIAVPMSVFGALAFLYLGFATINIYTQVGLITLIGLITKQSILVVQYANTLQQTEGLDRRAAVEKASAIRLRPILMTTAAMVLGVLPLLLASGPGAVSRFHMGLVIAAGLSIGALISLYVVPVIYSYLAAERQPAATSAIA